jgi:hypothetical protein
MPGLPDHWRPSDCGILVGFLSKGNTRDDDIPAEYAGRPIVEFKILEPDAAQMQELAATVGASVNAGIPTFLGVAGPPGYKAAKVFLKRSKAPLLPRTAMRS